ncbi:DNA internalization-related competence protein ComEC/Rec2 [Salinisphaera sp. PC39]|uniref:DNA internalization-related competence protein ComEC/Rec2 n=1 Tax=Salinisphaera sp. PC39 TaxID=1304156 RepID=UPI00333FA5F3
MHALPALPAPAWLLPPLLLCLFRFPGRTLAAVAALAFAYAVLLGSWLHSQRLPATAHGQERWFTGHVAGLPEVDEFRTRFRFETGARPRYVRVSWYDRPPALAPGDCWRLRLRLSAPRGSLNPGGFDYEAWLWRERIGATGYVREAERCADDATAPLARWRHAAAGRIAAALDGDPVTGLVQALSLGERGDITDDQWRVLRRTGTTHLFAISGLHVGLIAAAVFLGLRRAVPWLYPRPRPAALTVAAAAAALAATGYALLSGFDLPARRALIMTLAVLAAVLLRRRTAPSRLLAVAALAVLAADPFAVLAPGFWLSFGAVAWLLYLAGGRGRPGPAFWLRLQPALALALLPLTLYWFGEASLAGAVANAVLIPAFAVLVPAVLLTVLAALALPALAGPLLAALAVVLDAGWRLLAALADVPGAYLVLPTPGLPALVVALAGAAWLLAPRGVPGRWLGVLGLLPLLLGPPAPAHGGFRLTLLDVGQGLAAVVRTAEHTLLFDAGPRYRTGFDTGAAIVVPYLRSQGVRRLDRLVLSHGDIDHRGGVAAVRAALPVAATLGVDQAAPCRDGRRWTWDGVEFRVLHPGPGDWRGNDASCVLSVTGPGGRVLLTGDIEAPAERRLLAAHGESLRAAVLVVAHHGSASSSSAPFLAAVAPDYALVPAGWRNRWGFPAAAVRQRLREAGAEVRVTGAQGALRVDVDPVDGVAAPRAWRAQAARFWRAAPGP